MEKEEIDNKKDNAHNLDPRQSLFLQYYLDPSSETFSNVMRSGMKAGYTRDYSENMLHRVKWLPKYINGEYLVQKAEENLKKFLEMSDDDYQRLKVKADISKFVLERLNKNKYSQKNEVGGTITHINIDSDIAEKNDITQSAEASSEEST